MVESRRKNLRRMDFQGQPEKEARLLSMRAGAALRYERSAYVSMRKSGRNAPSRVAPQELLLSQQSLLGDGFFYFSPSHRKKEWSDYNV